MTSSSSLDDASRKAGEDPLLQRDPLIRSKHIEDIPDEILCEVFLCLVQQEACRFYSKQSPTYPQELMQVCKSWKRVCLDNPKLWSYIRLAAHNCEKKLDPTPLLRICQQLDRSKKSSLSIDTVRLCACEEQISCFRAVVKHCDRWGSVKICQEDCERFRSLVGPDRQFSTLREIEWVGSWGPHGVGGSLLLPFRNCNDLVGLHSASFPSLEHHDTQDQFPWDRLTTLSLPNYRGDLPDLARMLSKCRNVAHLDIGFPGDRILKRSNPALSTLTAHYVSLPRLLSLEISTDWDIPDGFEIISHLRLPNLLHLKYGGKIFSSSLRDIVKTGQWASSLTKLDIHFPDHEQAEFAQILDSLPNLQHLSLFRDLWYLDVPGELEDEIPEAYCDEFLGCMTVQDGESPQRPALLPNLRRLELTELAFDPILLAEMVESRIRTSTRDTAMASDDVGPSPISLQFLKLRLSEYGKAAPRTRYYRRIVQNLLGDYVRDGHLALEL